MGHGYAQYMSQFSAVAIGHVSSTEAEQSTERDHTAVTDAAVIKQTDNATWTPVVIA